MIKMRENYDRKNFTRITLLTTCILTVLSAPAYGMRKTSRTPKKTIQPKHEVYIDLGNDRYITINSKAILEKHTQLTSKNKNQVIEKLFKKYPDITLDDLQQYIKRSNSFLQNKEKSQGMSMPYPQVIKDIIIATNLNYAAYAQSNINTLIAYLMSLFPVLNSKIEYSQVLDSIIKEDSVGHTTIKYLDKNTAFIKQFITQLKKNDSDNNVLDDLQKMVLNKNQNLTLRFALLLLAAHHTYKAKKHNKFVVDSKHSFVYKPLTINQINQLKKYEYFDKATLTKSATYWARIAAASKGFWNYTKSWFSWILGNTSEKQEEE